VTSSLEIGSIIAGRYRITGHVVSSAEGDDVLSGLDQVLNRNVSILVAAKKNASQATQSGRELATGERQSSIQVLDMVISDGRPALITNTSRANELLDLLVSQDRPYVEPFFTESLGSELFGQKREALPEEDLEWDENYYDLREEKPLIDLSSMSERAKARAAERAAARDAAAAQRAEAQRQKEAAERAAAASAATAAASAASSSPAASGAGAESASSSAADESLATQAVPQVAAPARADLESRRPSVRPLGPEGDDDAAATRAVPLAGAAAGAAGSSAAGSAAVSRPAAAQSTPAPATEDDDDVVPVDDDPYDDVEEEPNRKGRVFSRALVGLLLAAMLIGAVVLAVTQLGSLFKDGSFAGASKPSTSASASSGSPSASPSASPTKAAVPAQVASIQRLVPDNPTLDAGSDGSLGRIIDGNPQSSWGSLVYTNPTFGNLTKSFNFVLELKEPTTLTELQLTQQYGSGGAFQVLVNDTASLDGATQVGQGTFSSANVTVALNGNTAKKYVIVKVTELPRLTGVQAVYPWGMVIAEIGVK
jgi:hypothetical protein